MKKEKGCQTSKVHDTMNSKFSSQGTYKFISRIEVYHNNEGIYGLFPFYNYSKLDESIKDISFYNDFKMHYEFSVLSSNMTKGISTNHEAIEFKYGEVITSIKGFFDEDSKKISTLKIVTNISNYTLGKASLLNTKATFYIGKEGHFIPGFKTSFMTDKNTCNLSYLGVYYEDSDNYYTKYFETKKSSKFSKIVNESLKKLDKFIYSAAKFLFIIFLVIFPILYYYAKSQNILGGDVRILSPRNKDYLSNYTQIHTDSHGFTHIKASNFADSMFTLGFTHARDRLWQIEITRRFASGRLSEIFGPKTLKVDRMIRNIGLASINEQKTSQLKYSKNFNHILKYIEGINYYAANFPLPPEYHIVGAAWTEYTPTDVCGIVNLITLSLSPDWFVEVAYKHLEEGVGKDFADLVFSIKLADIPFGEETIVTDQELIELGLHSKDKGEARIIEEIDEEKIKELKSKVTKKEKKETKESAPVKKDSSPSKQPEVEVPSQKEIIEEVQIKPTEPAEKVNDNDEGIKKKSEKSYEEFQITSKSSEDQMKEFEQIVEKEFNKQAHETNEASFYIDDELLDIPVNQGASNSWVISGKHTESGFPILSNDPHLPNSIPGAFYVAKIYLPDNIISGMTVPGAPLFTIGSTQWAAWGVTSDLGDQIDFCEEKIEEEYYYLNGIKFPIIKTEEVIIVKGQEDDIIEVSWTKNGPIINENLKRLHPGGLSFKSTIPLSFRVSWYLNNEFSIDYGFALINSKKFKQILPEIRKITSPLLSFSWANVDGEIAYTRIGKLPLKNPTSSNLYKKSFCKGWKEEDQLKGFLPESQYSNVINPSKGYIITANNKPESDNFVADYHGLFMFSRAKRIKQLLTEKINSGNKISIKDNLDFLADVKDVYAENILPKLLEIYERNKKKVYEEFRSHVSKMQEYQQIAQSNPDFEPPKSSYEPPQSLVYMEHLRKWNYTMESDSHLATIYSILHYNIGLNLMQPLSTYNAQSILSLKNFWNFIYSMINKIHSGKVVELKQCSYLSGSRNCEKYLVKVIDNLAQYIKDDPATFQGNVPFWGKVAYAHYPHATFDKHFLLKHIFSRSTPSRGNFHTIKVGVNKFNNPLGKFVNAHSPASQLLVDLKNPTEPLVNVSTGNSGNVLSKFYDNKLLNTEKAELVEFKNFEFPETSDSLTLLLHPK